MPEFFVPLLEPERQEEAYHQLAAHVGAFGRPAGERIYSMTWRHDRVIWTATVGEKLRGTETVVVGRGRDKREQEVPRSTSDTVLAIFPGSPGLIAHDNHSRRWNMPILTGQELQLVHFD